MPWEEVKKKVLEHIHPDNGFVRIPSCEIWRTLEEGDKEIALQKGMRQNLDTEIMELNKEIARQKESHERNQQVWMKYIEECHKEIARLENELLKAAMDCNGLARKIIRNHALEQAAKVVDKCEYMSACNMDIAKEIRALKEEP